MKNLKKSVFFKNIQKEKKIAEKKEKNAIILGFQY